MQNGTNFSAEMLNSLFQLMKKGKDSQESVRSILEGSLTDSQRQAVKGIMSDPQKMKELLSSPEAQELLRKFGRAQGENKNGSA